MGKWFYTDDMQICRKIKDGIFEFVEFSECDEEYYLAEQQKIILANWKDSDGEWDSDAQQIIKTYYKSLDGLRSAVSSEDEDQIVAEMIYECTSSLADELSMTEKEAREYLENIIDNEFNILSKGKGMKEEKHYYKFVSYTDGSGYCEGLRIKFLTPSEVERRRKCGIIYERVDKKDKKEEK